MSSGLVVGIDLGATNVRVALGSLGRGILKRVEEKTVRDKRAEKLIEQLIKLIEAVAGDGLNEVKAIGIGSIGPLDSKRGIILKPANAPFRDIHIVEALSERFKIPAYLLNDCNAAVLGEKFFGAGKKVENLFYVTLSSGIGGGAIVDGNLLFGKDGNAVEIGHLVVDLEGRLRCGCGARGHWEAYCSGRNIPNFARYLVNEDPERFRGSEIEKLVKEGGLTSEVLFDLAKRGDEHALLIVEEIGKLNAIGFANINTCYDPEIITIGGSVALYNQDLIIPPIIENIGKYTINNVPEIKITPLGGDAVLYGAIALAENPPPQLRG